jgi:uroporphyrinogen-III synthase
MKLYLGTDPSEYGEAVIHYPVIELERVEPDPKVFQALFKATHFLFTSKHAVDFFFQTFTIDLSDKVLIAIGPVTAKRLRLRGYEKIIIPEEATQEGVIERLKKEEITHVFYPRSALARDLLLQFFIENKICHTAFTLYETRTIKNPPPLDFSGIEEIIFTSPSTVNSFLELFHSFPPGAKLTAIGPITRRVLVKSLMACSHFSTVI